MLLKIKLHLEKIYQMMKSIKGIKLENQLFQFQNVNLVIESMLLQLKTSKVQKIFI